ncbi:MAG TPA: hypothetical protein VGD99_28870 [Anaerolineae bacterium]
MRRRQLIIFTTVLCLIGILSLAYSARALADLTTLYQNSAGPLGVELILSPDTTLTSASVASEEILLEAQQIVSQRMGNLRLAGSYSVAVEDERLVIRLPDNENMPYIASIISSVGEIEFINGGPTSPPIGRRVETAAKANPELNVYQTLFTGQDVESALPPNSASGQIFYQLVLEPTTVKRFARFVETQPGYYMCMVMDQQVINCSKMYHWSAADTVDILPGLSSGADISLADLSIFLDSGPLPMPLKVITR